ncbi:hypothetical protein [Micromonospora craniellae]|uniref:hypothetical protein n=1 Tax=Micromonospora craniellae TaxID=2294034 RepID=UPI0018F149A9|nr:hypothetical protein [Micromonospora craniellae]
MATATRRPALPLWVASAVLAVAATLIAPRTVTGVLSCALATAAATALIMGWLAFRRSAADRGNNA